MSFKAENIIQIELDMPNRTTRDYEGPSVAPTLQAVLESALRGEDDLTLDARFEICQLIFLVFIAYFRPPFAYCPVFSYPEE